MHTKKGKTLLYVNTYLVSPQKTLYLPKKKIVSPKKNLVSPKKTLYLPKKNNAGKETPKDRPASFSRENCTSCRMLLRQEFTVCAR